MISNRIPLNFLYYSHPHAFARFGTMEKLMSMTEEEMTEERCDSTTSYGGRGRYIAWAKDHGRTVRRLLTLALGSRLLLILAGWIANYYPKNPTYQRYIDQGFQFTPRWLIDMWCRWDSSWYLSIAGGGYSAGESLGNAYSNMAFFPLYPDLVRLLTVWLPSSVQSPALLLTAGLAISNLCFFASIVLLYALTLRLTGEKAVAGRTALLTVCLPAAYIFSAFYTESLFFFLSLCVCVAAERDRWALSAVFAALAALTRANGFVIVLVPAWIYMSRRGWDFRRLGWRWTWFLLVPLAIAAHFFTLYLKTGDFFAFFMAQKAWARGTVSPIGILRESIDALRDPSPQLAILDRAAFLAYLTISACAIWREKTLRAYAVYAAGLMLAYGASGLMYSMTRYTLVVFPAAIFASLRIRNEEAFRWLCAALAVIQTLLWIGWTNYYWIC